MAVGSQGGPDQTVVLATQVITESLPGMLLILFVPVFAGLLFVSNRGRGRYVGNLVAALHIHTLGFLMVVATVPLNSVLGEEWQEVGMPLLAVAFFAFFVASLARVQDTGLLKATVQSVVVLGIYGILIGGLIGSLLGIIMA